MLTEKRMQQLAGIRVDEKSNTALFKISLDPDIFDKNLFLKILKQESGMNGLKLKKAVEKSNHVVLHISNVTDNDAAMLQSDAATALTNMAHGSINLTYKLVDVVIK